MNHCVCCVEFPYAPWERGVGLRSVRSVPTMNHMCLLKEIYESLWVLWDVPIALCRLPVTPCRLPVTPCRILLCSTGEGVWAGDTSFHC